MPIYTLKKVLFIAIFPTLNGCLKEILYYLVSNGRDGKDKINSTLLCPGNFVLKRLTWKIAT